jgi:hypothetical protein
MNLNDWVTKYITEINESGLEERILNLTEKNTPTDPSKWSYYKSQAKKKFDVYPSAYANAWAAKKYKAAGGGWRKSESINEENPCWDGYKQVGMKSKGGKQVPNCVKESVNESTIDMSKNPRIIFGDLYDAVFKFQKEKAKDVLGKAGLKELDNLVKNMNYIRGLIMMGKMK